ncbi:zinc-binding oxidoreductase CipB [Penicillium brevicompactum]|uniref:Zinc-binding oxidoreductase CipB n=1 Tax=Penicillium brevicompactum TaxID=5074 RepID=A0A9W9UTZ9_PENBR|nr:zinc-binding oxidoreductase CipB [Penicillium brevicompactum]
MTQNRAAWIMAPMSKPLFIGNAPVYRPGPGEILIKAHSVAVNPVDWKIQDSGRYLRTYPFILGRDAAGTVKEVGEGVTRFHKGQRVIASSGDPANAAYQTYSVALERLAAALPSHLSFEEGAVMPLAISTAAASLYLPEYLGLSLPSREPNPTDKTLLIWGGSSSSLGAVEVFDYKSPQVIQDLVARLQSSEVVGIYDAIGETSSLTSLSMIVNHLAHPIKSVTVHPFENPTLHFAPSYVSSYGIAFPPNETIGEVIWGDFVPRALESGQLKAKPEPLILARGLENIQNGLDRQKAGVSAQKIVITI